jgi:segregation and condensation protein B
MSATSDDDIFKPARIEGGKAAKGSSPEAAELSLDSVVDFPNPDEEDEEFSLDQLSEAYAKVLRTGDQPSNPVPPATDSLSGNQGKLEMGGDQGAEETLSGLSRPAQLKVDREARDNAGCPITPESIVEALIFVGLPGNEPLTLKKLASLLRDVSPKEIKGIINQLNSRYEKDQSAFRIKLEAAAVKMVLDDSMLPFQQAFSRAFKGVKLNPATVEVLAIIAYNQPISREKIDDTRKRSSSAIVAQLVRRGLVTAVKNERSSQRTDYVTTEKFLNLFHLTDLSELPKGSDDADLDELLT